MATRRLPALLIVDMFSTMAFEDAAHIAAPAIDAARNIQKLRRHFHRQRWPVIYANDNFTHWHGEFSDMLDMARAAGGVAAHIAGMLAPTPDDHVMLKSKHSAFLGTPLPVLLAKLGVRELVVAGMSLESCVLSTALDANAREFSVVVARDAVAGLPPLHRPTLTVLSGSKAARVLNSQSVLAWTAAPSRRRQR